jgi:hypothetical protein
MSETRRKKSPWYTSEAIADILLGILTTQQLATKYDTTPQTIAVVRRKTLAEQGIIYKWEQPPPSEQTRQKISKAKIGIKRTPETKKKMSDARKGKKRSPEHIRKSAEAMIGLKHTEEARKKMSAAQRARFPHRTPEAVLDIQTSNRSIEELAAKYNVDGTTIYNIKREGRPLSERGRKKHIYRTPEAMTDIQNNSLPAADLAVKYGCVIETIWRIRNGK